MPVNIPNLGPGGTANAPFGQLNPTGGVFSGATDIAVQPPFTFTSDNSLGFYRSGASSVALSYGTLNLYTQSNRLSIRTGADATGLNIGELKVVFAASGISLIYSSGASYYIVGGSATSAAQA